MIKMGIDKKALDKALNDIALAVRKVIRDTTAKGSDMDGNKFKAYSKSYAKEKLDYQRGKRDISAARIARANLVNLMLTGTMLRSMSVSKIKEGYEIYFPDKELAIRAWTHHTGAGRMPKRKFFGVSSAVESALYKQYMNPDKVARFYK